MPFSTGSPPVFKIAHTGVTYKAFVKGLQAEGLETGAAYDFPCEKMAAPFFPVSREEGTYCDRRLTGAPVPVLA